MAFDDNGTRTVTRKAMGAEMLSAETELELARAWRNGCGAVTRPRGVLSSMASRVPEPSVLRRQSFTSSSSTPQRGERMTKSGWRARGPMGTSCQTR